MELKGFSGLPVGVMSLALVVAALVTGAPPAKARTCDGVTVACQIGDTGPGGGVVFYDAGQPQPWGRYLEAAPAGWFNVPGAQDLRPGTPEGLSVVVRPGSAKVSSRRLPDAGRVRYVVRTRPGGAGCRTSGSSCTVVGLASGREYAFWVVAVNATGAGEPSGTVTVRIPLSTGVSRPTPKPAPTYRSGPGARSLDSSDPGEMWCPRGAGGYGTLLATGTDLGSGRVNSSIVLDACGRDTAVGLAVAYKGGGLDDWYLPSRDEVSVMFQQRAVIGGLDDSYLWTSSQSDSLEFAWYHSFFAGGTPSLNHKGSIGRVRPVRAF